MPYTGPERKRNRALNLNYRAPGAYFVTIVTHYRVCVFGQVTAGSMTLTPAGSMVERAWYEIPQQFGPLLIEPLVVMPNHLHAIVHIPSPRTDHQTNQPTLSDIIGWFKTVTTNRYITGVRTEGWPPYDRHLWQKSFHDHRIRSPHELVAINAYIRENPARWNEDTYYEPDLFDPISPKPQIVGNS